MATLLLLPSLSSSSSSSSSLLLSSHYSSSSSLKSSPLSPPLKLSSARRWSSVIVVSASSSSTTNAGSTRSDDETKRMALERYGLDPADFTSQRSRRRREGEEKSRRGRRRQQQDVMASPVGERKPPRTTHKLLQVLGGKARRKKLLSPKGMDVRPMMEVVRGAAFDILQVAGGCPASLRPGRWLDLYSGTGSVGIEAISRGCSEAHFVEMDPWVVSEVLKPNLEWTGFLDYSVIHTIRVESFLEQAGKSLGKDKSFDYVSVTPPYTAVDYTILMEQLGNSPLIGEDCFILVEYALKTPMADSCGHLIKLKSMVWLRNNSGDSHCKLQPKDHHAFNSQVADRRFGRTNLVIYGPTWAQKKKRKSERSVVPPLDRASD